MDLVMTLVTGGFVGWLASLAMAASRQMSLLGYILVGVVGSFVGGWLAGILGVTVQGSFGHWLVSFLGAALLVWLVRAVAGTATSAA
jgi:uncharacterized membrane protein YeaQ/YmgE (transglycosylase-associated protein family)